jgi:hypothetical protein
LLFFNLSSVFADDMTLQKQKWLLGITSRFEVERDEINAQIQKSKTMIERCENIINAALETGNDEAKLMATDALRHAESAKNKFEKKKHVAETSIFHMQRQIANLSESNAKDLHYVVAGYTGDVGYRSAGEGKFIPLASNSNKQPQPGDMIYTGQNGRAELYFFDRDGGGNMMTLGKHTMLHLEKDKAGLSQFEKVKLTLMKGYLHFQESIDWRVKAKHKKRTELIEEWEECAEKYGLDSVKCKNYFSRIARTVWSGAVACSIRGTEFAIHEDEKKGTQIFVFKGSVIVSNNPGNKIKIIDAGYSIEGSPEGEMSEPRKIDLSSVSQWWKE